MTVEYKVFQSCTNETTWKKIFAPTEMCLHHNLSNTPEIMKNTNVFFIAD